jgi:hypothetical protein
MRERTIFGGHKYEFLIRKGAERKQRLIEKAAECLYYGNIPEKGYKVENGRAFLLDFPLTKKYIAKKDVKFICLF